MNPNGEKQFTELRGECDKKMSKTHVAVSARAAVELLSAIVDRVMGVNWGMGRRILVLEEYSVGCMVDRGCHFACKMLATCP